MTILEEFAEIKKESDKLSGMMNSREFELDYKQYDYEKYGKELREEGDFNDQGEDE